MTTELELAEKKIKKLLEMITERDQEIAVLKQLLLRQSKPSRRIMQAVPQRIV